MPKKLASSDVQEWVGAGFKAAVTVISTLLVFFMSQLNGSIASLTAQLKNMEVHQVDTDRRVAAIEISREVSMESYKKVVGDVQKSVQDIQEIKSSIGQMNIRVQTMADFMVSVSKKNK